MGRLTIATKFNTARLLQFVFPAVAMMIVTSIYVMTDGIFISCLQEVNSFRRPISCIRWCIC